MNGSTDLQRALEWLDGHHRQAADELHEEFPGLAEPREFGDGVYYLRIEGDRQRMIDGDIVEVVENHYAVKATPLTKADGQPQRVPLEVRISVRDCYGREAWHTGTWEVVESEPGAKGLTVQTGVTNNDLDGVRAQVEIRVGL